MNRGRVGSFAGALAGVVIALQPLPGRAQDRLVRAAVNVDLGAGGATASVRVLYIVAPAAGTDTIPFAVVLFGGASLDHVSAGVDGSPVDLVLDGAEEIRRTGSVAIPAQPRREVAVELTYTVDGAVTAATRRAGIPVLAIPWPPAEALPGTFSASITMPEDLRAWDAVPSLIRETGVTDGLRRYEVELQVVPALLSFRLTEGSVPVLTATTLIDAVTIILVLLVGYAGWLRFRVRA